MLQFKIGDKVKLQPPFTSTKTYTILSIDGMYATLFCKGEHKNLVIYIKCIKQRE